MALRISEVDCIRMNFGMGDAERIDSKAFWRGLVIHGQILPYGEIAMSNTLPGLIDHLAEVI